MQLLILIAKDKTINGVYTSKDKLIQDLVTTLSNITIDHVELWESDKGFIKNVNIQKQTIISFDN